MARDDGFQRNVPPRKKDMTDDDEIRGRLALNRDDTRLSREVDTRVRDDFYDLPDVDNFDPSVNIGKLQLLAPPPRVDERHGKMRQHWVAHKHNNGHRIQQLMDIGYRVRHPNTVPPSFTHFTEQWQGKDVIMVAGDHILMETSEKNYLKIKKFKKDKNDQIMNDIRSTHGQVVRDGEVQDFRDKGAGSFTREVVINHDNSGGDVSFAD